MFLLSKVTGGSGFKLKNRGRCGSFYQSNLDGGNFYQKIAGGSDCLLIKSREWVLPKFAGGTVLTGESRATVFFHQEILGQSESQNLERTPDRLGQIYKKENEIVRGSTAESKWKLVRGSTTAEIKKTNS